MINYDPARALRRLDKRTAALASSHAYAVSVGDEYRTTLFAGMLADVATQRATILAAVEAEGALREDFRIRPVPVQPEVPTVPEVPAMSEPRTRARRYAVRVLADRSPDELAQTLARSLQVLVRGRIGAGEREQLLGVAGRVAGELAVQVAAGDFRINGESPALKDVMA